MNSLLEVIMHTDFATSEFKALALGYHKVSDARAYGGVYYIKDGKRWIFNLPALARVLGVSSPQDFATAGYAIEDFLLYGALSIPDFMRLLQEEASEKEKNVAIRRKHCFEGADDAFVSWLAHTLHQQTF
jgi:cytoplasmic protein